MPKKTSHNIVNAVKQHQLLSVLIALLLCLSFYLRAEPALFNISHFSFDQGLDIILAKRLVVDHKLSLISRYTGLEGVMMGPLYSWFLTIPFFISGGSPNFNVIFMSLFGTIAAVYTFFIVRRMSNPVVAAIAAFYAAFAPPFIGSSKIVLSPAPLTFITIIYIWLIWEIIAKSRYKLLPLLAFIASAFFHFEIGFAIFATPAAIAAIFALKGLKPLLTKNTLYAAIAFLVPFLPQILFDLRHDFLITNAIKSFFTGENDSLGSESVGLIGRFFIRLDTFNEDLFSALTFGNNHPLMIISAVAIIGYGWYLVYKQKDKPLLLIGKILGLFTLVTYLGFVIFKGPVWPWYRAGMPTIFSLFAAISLGKILTSKKHYFYFKNKSWQAKTSVILFIAAIFLPTLRPGDRIEVVQGKYKGNVSTIRNQQATLDSIYADASGKPFALYVYTPPVYTYIWDYQLYWYAQPKYGYLPKPYDAHPQTDNPELIYLLIETGGEYPTEIKGWLGNFKQYGKAIKVWSLPGEVSIEKWQFASEPQTSQPLIKYVDVFEQ